MTDTDHRGGGGGVRGKNTKKLLPPDQPQEIGGVSVSLILDILQIKVVQ